MFINKEGEKLHNQKLHFEKLNVGHGGDPDIIRFVSDIRYHGSYGVTAKDTEETIRSLFENGYCYYFAKMLEDAFPGGKICLCYPIGHMVYVYEGVAYDISGVSDAEHEFYMPIEEIGGGIHDFKHVQGFEYNMSEEELAMIGKECKENKTYLQAISKYDIEVLERTKNVIKQIPDSQYATARTNYVIEEERLSHELQKEYITPDQYKGYIREYCGEIGVCFDLIRRMEKRGY